MLSPRRDFDPVKLFRAFIIYFVCGGFQLSNPGLHQGSALSPLLFIIIMDVWAEEARTKPPWAMLFVDDLVLVSETVEEVEEELERWRAVIENKGLRISRSKTEYLVPSHQQGVVKLEGEPLPSVNSFKYLGSVIDGSGGCGKDVDGRIKVAWSRWRDLSGVIYDKRYLWSWKASYTKQLSDLRWYMGVSVGHCASKKNSVYIPPKWKC